MIRNLKDEWADFERSVLPKDASNNQREQMKSAFYGGSWIVLQVVRQLADLPEEEGVKILEGFIKEVQEFYESFE